MDLSRAMGALLRRWWLLVLCGLVAAGVAYAASAAMPREYQAETVVLVGSLTTTDPVEHQGYRELAQTYALLVDTPLVLDPVSEQLGLDEGSAAALSDRIAARSTTGQSLIVITATAATAEDAALTARTVASTLTALSQGQGLGDSALATVVEEAQIPAGASSPRPALNTGVGAAVGVLLAAVVVLIWSERRGQGNATAAPPHPAANGPYAPSGYVGAPSAGPGPARPGPGRR